MKAPHFWSAGLDPRSREAAPLTRALLTPLEALYIWGVRRKLRTATPAQAAIPVICVGNLTTGGSGKTPIVTEIRERLTAKGLRAASLSRGYGGSDPGPRPVHPETDTARQTGDESLMLSHTGEAWIGRDRPDAARQMTAEGVDIIIMDDGFQNPSLAKDVSIIVIDAAAPFGNGFALPKGPLREPVADGLARADAVILMGDGRRARACGRVRDTGVAGAPSAQRHGDAATCCRFCRNWSPAQILRYVERGWFSGV